MLICVSVYHDACLGHSSSAVMWQQRSIHRNVAANWPFPLVYHTALCGKHKCQQTFKWICLLCLRLWSMILHLSSASSSLPQSELGGIRARRCPCRSLSLSPVCVSSQWVTEKWCEPRLLSGCSARESIHCLALCSGCQSVSVSVCHSKGEQKGLK